MAIHPYPAHLVSTWCAPDGSSVAIRPIRPEDAEIEREFVTSLSPAAKYMRFMSTLNELTPAMVAHFTQIDYDREMALIAVVPEGAGERQIGVCRYAVDADDLSCEFALVIAEPWQRRGLGRHLMERLIEVARAQPETHERPDILCEHRDARPCDEARIYARGRSRRARCQGSDAPLGAVMTQWGIG